MSMFRRAMDYLGLGPDEAYDEYDESVPAERTVKRPMRPNGRFDRRAFENDVQQVDEYEEPEDEYSNPRVRGQQTQHDSGVTVRPPIGRRGEQVVRPLLSSADPVTLRPQTYEEAKEIADLFKQGNPIIINVQSTDPKIMRRIIDFASGVSYAQNGTMEKLSVGVYMMKPYGARVTRG